MGTLKESIEFCKICHEHIMHPIEGCVCGVTKQPRNMMYGCPMENDDVRCDYDPAFVWFPTSKHALNYCNYCAWGSPCHFKTGERCQVPGNGVYPIKDMQRCPVIRYDENLTYIQPMDVYPVLRDAR